MSREAVQRCERHGNQCAYTGTEPDRCPMCHRGWSVITGRDELLRAKHADKRAKKAGAVRPPAVVRAEHERDCGRPRRRTKVRTSVRTSDTEGDDR
jgi:hypothetical protein